MRELIQAFNREVDEAIAQGVLSYRVGSSDRIINAHHLPSGRKIWLYINNAAIFAGRAFYARDFDPAEMLGSFATNVVGPALLARELRAPLLQVRLKLILMMSTGNASLMGNISGEMLAYRATKIALNPGHAHDGG